MNALRAGELVQAEIAAEKAAARGGPEVEAWRDFLLGNVAFVRCEKEEHAAMGPRGASAIDAALRHAERARKLWELAAAGRADWPEARRNVERARFKIEDLRKKKEELEPQRQSQPRHTVEPDPGKRELPAKDQQLAAAPRVRPTIMELPAERVLGLLDKLQVKEEDKRKVRRAEQKTRYAAEKDW